MIIYVYRDFMISLQVFLILFQYYPSVSVGHLADLLAKEPFGRAGKSDK